MSGLDSEKKSQDLNCNCCCSDLVLEVLKNQHMLMKVMNNQNELLVQIVNQNSNLITLIENEQAEPKKSQSLD